MQETNSGRSTARCPPRRNLAPIAEPVARKGAACYCSGRRIQEGVMIHHLSIAARNPKHSAGVLAEIMGGKSVPFPPNPGSFFALQLDDHGSGVEVYPSGTELHPAGAEGGSFVKKPQDGRG